MCRRIPPLRIWDKFKDEFDEDCIVHFVKTLEYDEIMADIKKLLRFEAVIGLGGGQAVDCDVIQNGPKALNRSGVCDVLCYNNSMFDWKYAADQGKREAKWAYNQEMVDEVREVYQSVVDNLDETYNLTEKGIRILTEGLRWGGGAFHNNGWNPRPIEGSDHFLFYTLEYMTKKKFIHGQPVCLGIFVGSAMANNDPDGILGIIHRADETMLKNGLITELESRRNLENVIIVLHPALITSKENADEAVDIMDRSLRECLA